MTKIILPEKGPLIYGEDGTIRIVPFIYAQSDKKIIYVAIPDKLPICGVITKDTLSTPIKYKKAIYVRESPPNCEGIAHFRLKEIIEE